MRTSAEHCNFIILSSISACFFQILVLCMHFWHVKHRSSCFNFVGKWSMYKIIAKELGYTCDILAFLFEEFYERAKWWSCSSTTAIVGRSACFSLVQL